MNKVVLLKEIKNECKCKKNIEIITESLTNAYSDFEKNIFNNKLNKKNNENVMSKILEKIFYLNKSLFINFVNSIYNDYLGTNCLVKFYYEYDKENCLLVSANSVINVKVEDEYRTSEYRIEIQSDDYENIAILIYKKKDTDSNSNVVNFKKKKEEYKSLIENKEKEKNSNMCLIMLNSTINIPEDYNIEGNYIKIIKLWKYDLKILFEKEMQLLFPTKVLDLSNVIESMKNMSNSEKIIEDEIKRFYNSMDRYMIKLIESNVISEEEKDLLCSSSKEILSLIY